jgi:AAA+ superfamily predicted ATPase
MAEATGTEIAEGATSLTEATEPSFLARVRLRCRLRVHWMRSVVWGSSDEIAQGLAIPHGEVDRVLNDPLELAEAEERFLAHDAEAQRILGDLESVEEKLQHDAHWNWFRQEFRLSQIELDLFSLCLAVETNPALRRVCGYLHDDAAACYPTQWLASTLFRWPSGTMIGIASPLVRWRMASPAEGSPMPWGAQAAWIPDPHMVAWFQNRAGLDPALESAARYLPASDSSTKPCLYPDTMSELAEFAGAFENSRTPMVLEIIGPHGGGKLTLAAQMGASLGAGLVAVNAASLNTGDLNFAAERSVADKMMRAVRMARLGGALLYWHDVDSVPSSAWAAIEGLAPLMIFGGRVPVNIEWRFPVVRKIIRLPPLTRAAQKALWEQLTTSAPPEPLQQWLMTPRDVVNAARAVPAGPVAVLEACRGAVQHNSSELFSRLPCPFTWDDIVLPPLIREHLNELEQQARLRSDVYEDWGFARLCPLGRGITAMFAGPSGTGKTMAAQVLARSLGMELYRVDLAGVMNKYIGETEKRIKQVFDISERGNVLLFFDEADALFGQRTQVKDAHDRFANIEIDYLLQRMEQFDGLAVLATNRKGDLDKAFLRRIRFIVDFMQPGRAERLAIWRKVLPDRAPSGEVLIENLDWEFLAEKLNLNGAEITAAALSAAFMARAEGTIIGMKHILHAARREMSKQGIVLRHGDWEG